MTGFPPDVDDLSVDELKELVLWLLERDAVREAEMAALREEIARLKGLKGRPKMRPSGMEPATERQPKGGTGDKRRRGGAKRVVSEERVITVVPPPGSRLKGYESYVVEDLVVRPATIRYRRQRWRTPAGETIVAPLPAGVRGHVGPELRRYVLALYHQGRMTVAGLLAHLDGLGVSVSKRQLVRLLIAGQEPFVDEAREVLRAGLETAAWISVDDTGARHQGANAICTQIGNDHFAWFATGASKSRLNFLDLLRAGHTDYVVNDAALAYMRKRNLAGSLIARLEASETRCFADDAAWTAHLDRLGVSGLAVNPDPVRIATEGALWGSVLDHRFLADAVIVSDDAGQFNVGRHALCWVHAERLIHKLDTFTDRQRQAVEGIRDRIWKFYADLKAYRQKPSARRKAALQRRFDALFTTRTGYVTLDRLLRRLHANKQELLAVLDRPEIPLHTNGSENDIRCQVIRRKISAGTRSETGRQCRDGFLSLIKTCQKLQLSFWAYLGNRLNIPHAPTVPLLPDVVRTRASPT
jgi:Transposase IS66 family